MVLFVQFSVKRIYCHRIGAFDLLNRRDLIVGTLLKFLSKTTVPIQGGGSNEE